MNSSAWLRISSSSSCMCGCAPKASQYEGAGPAQGGSRLKFCQFEPTNSVNANHAYQSADQLRRGYNPTSILCFEIGFPELSKAMTNGKSTRSAKKPPSTRAGGVSGVAFVTLVTFEISGHS